MSVLDDILLVSIGRGISRLAECSTCAGYVRRGTCRVAVHRQMLPIIGQGHEKIDPRHTQDRSYAVQCDQKAVHGIFGSCDVDSTRTYRNASRLTATFFLNTA